MPANAKQPGTPRRKIRSRRKRRTRRNVGKGHAELSGQVMFEVRTYDGKEIKASGLMAPGEVLQSFDFGAYDSVSAKPLGHFGFHDPETREWHDYAKRNGRGRGLGNVTLAILEAIQDFPGVYIEPLMLYDLTGIDTVPDPGVLPTHILRIRAAHWECKRTARFILTQNGCVAWAPDRTWIRVVPFIKKGSCDTARARNNGHMSQQEGADGGPHADGSSL